MTNVRSGSIHLARIAAIVLLTGLILGVIGPRLWASRAPSSPTNPPTRHVVGPGESLWKLAGRYAPKDDPRAFIFEVQQLNGLSTSAVSPGQKLIIPAG